MPLAIVFQVIASLIILIKEENSNIKEKKLLYKYIGLLILFILKKNIKI